MAAKPPMASGTTTDSVPPAIMTSASPRRMMFAASPMACAEVAQAVAMAVLGPFAPVRIETSPERHVDDEARDEERADPPGPLLEDDLVHLLDEGQAADAGADADAHALRVLRRDRRGPSRRAPPSPPRPRNG